ncbi:hypothetical protein [Streptomyces violascens]|uniref:hypothetical protein n=1 Tax=Streptomyces violascens TaxID=67381 RepID=UPI0036BFAB5F
MKTDRITGRRPRTTPEVLAAVAVLAVCAVGCDSASPRQHPTATPKPSTSAPASPPDFTLFAGDWHGHGNAMTVKTDGSFTMVKRTYKSCDQNPPPCDPNVGSQINDGAQASGRLDTVSGTVATGVITTTNDGPLLPAGPVTFTFDAANDAINALRLNWCGPKAPSGICY